MWERDYTVAGCRRCRGSLFPWNKSEWGVGIDMMRGMLIDISDAQWQTSDRVRAFLKGPVALRFR